MTDQAWNLERAIGAAIPHLPRSASEPDRLSYARDLWPRRHLAVRDGRSPGDRPALVVWPRDAEEVAAVVAWCAREGVPLVPFGAGSGVCGGVSPDARTVVLDLKRMQRWRRFAPDEASLEVESGALGITLEEALERKGLTLGHFPSSILCSTVGGWIAARSAGQCSGRYGKIEDMVASLECVVGRGEIVRFERRVEGPDVTPLVIGSEGVLGVVTSATLRLHPAPAERAFAAFSFDSIEDGWSAMRRMFQEGLRPAVARLYDPFDSAIARMGAVRRDRTRGATGGGGGAGSGAGVLRAVLRVPGALNRVVDTLGGRVLRGSTLILVFEGAADESRADAERAARIASSLGAKPLGEGPARHWLEHRYGVSYRQAPVFMAGAFSDTMEVAAPWSRLEGLYRAVREALGRHVFVMAHLSHAYPDGCSIYFTFAGTGRDPSAMESTYDAAWRAALDAAIGAGGTLSHHHGVGRSKAPRLGAELGAGVDVVRALARELDPAGIMNPGNLLPPRSPARRPPAPVPAAPALDRDSMLVHVSGTTKLAHVEDVLAREGWSLGIAAGSVDPETSVADWLADGAKGAPDPWLDPVDHLVAGFTATLAGGAHLDVRPCPRRAVGPDLWALFHGTRGGPGRIESVHLRARGSERPRPLETRIARNPPTCERERLWIERLVTAAGRVA